MWRKPFQSSGSRDQLSGSVGCSGALRAHPRTDLAIRDEFRQEKGERGRLTAGVTRRS